MDASRQSEQAPTKNVTSVERNSDREVVVTRWFNASARVVFVVFGSLRMLSATSGFGKRAAKIRSELDAAADPQGARFALGVLPDLSGLYPRLTAREHIEYFGELQGITGADLRRRTGELLTLLDMTGIADRRVAGFSHGERTKTALARAIVHNPKNVLLDEPTNGLDVMSTRAVREIIRRLKSEGHTVLFSSHVMQEVSALSDTIVVIARGKIVAAGSPDDLRRLTGHENLEDAFVALSGLEPETDPVAPGTRHEAPR